MTWQLTHRSATKVFRLQRQANLCRAKRAVQTRNVLVSAIPHSRRSAIASSRAALLTVRIESRTLRQRSEHRVKALN